MVMHAPIEGSNKSEMWWIESGRVARLHPSHGATLFAAGNGRVGSSVSEAIGLVRPESATMN